MSLRRYRPAELDLAAVRERLVPLLATKDDSESLAELERLLRKVAG